MPTEGPGDYDDAPAQAADAGGDNPERATGTTAMLNKAVLGGRDYQPGDSVSLRILAVHGDEVEVECGHDSENAESGSPTPEPGMYD